MTRHVFPQPHALRVALLAGLVLASAAVVRAQDEPTKPAADPSATAAPAEEAARTGPPAVGDAFPTHLPFVPLPPEGAAEVANPDPGDSAETETETGRPAPGADGAQPAGGASPAAATKKADEGYALAKLVGDEPRPLIVVFWSSKCVVCKRYAASLTALAAKLTDRAAIAVVVSGAEVTADEARRVLESAGAGVEVFLDTDLLAADELGVRVTPTAFVVGADNVLRYRGPIDDDRRARPRDARALLLPAAEAVIGGSEVESADVPPFGSAIR